MINWDDSTDKQGYVTSRVTLGHLRIVVEECECRQHGMMRYDQKAGPTRFTVQVGDRMIWPKHPASTVEDTTYPTLESAKRAAIAAAVQTANDILVAIER